VSAIQTFFGVSLSFTDITQTWVDNLKVACQLLRNGAERGAVLSQVRADIDKGCPVEL
jgi:hypothetical protein